MQNLLFIILIAFTVSTSAYAEDRQSFVGAWELTKIEGKDDNGNWIDFAPEGTRFVGSIMYSASGKMQAQLHLTNRTHEMFKNHPEFMAGYAAYYADYSVNDKTNVVTHERLGHVNIEEIKDVQRSYIFKDDLLILSPLPDGNVRLIWTRVKP
jgi:hypothetical protein